MELLRAIQSQMDHELMWIASEAKNRAFKAGAETALLVDIVREVSAAVGETLRERQPDLPVQQHEYLKLAYNVLREMDKDKRQHTGYLAERICEACVAYAQLRSFGMPTSYPVEATAGSDYVVYEGGFCNPMKLKFLYEED